MYLVKYSAYPSSDFKFREFNTKELAKEWIEADKNNYNKVLFCNATLMEKLEEMLSTYQGLLNQLLKITKDKTL